MQYLAEKAPLYVRRSRIAISIGSVLIGCALLISCSGSQPRPTEPAVPLRIGFVRIADSAQLYVGVEKGFYDKEGLRLDLQELQSGSRILEALGSRSTEGVDVGFSSLVSVILARARGLRIVTFSGGPMEEPTRPTHGLLVSMKSPITDPKMLAGKKIAVNALKNVEHLMLTRYLRLENVVPTSVTVVEIGFPQMPTVLKAGQVDAVCAIEPYLTAAVQRGDGKLLAHHYLTVSKLSLIHI